jgi:hypothetical protein
MSKFRDAKSFFEAYNGKVGALASFIPALLFLLLAFLGGATFNEYLRGLIIFTPLILISYILDKIYLAIKVKGVDRRNPIFAICLLWLILFPLSRVGSEIIILTTTAPSELHAFIAKLHLIIIFMPIFGLIYGLYFWIVYLYINKLLRYLS